MSRLFVDKRGGIGRIITIFFSLIVVAMVLVAFVLVASIWKIFNTELVGGVKYDAEGDSENFFEYVNGSYLDLAEVKYKVSSGEKVSEVLK